MDGIFWTFRFCEFRKCSAVEVRKFFRKKTEFSNSQKTRSDSKTDSKVWLKVWNAGPYNIELTSCLKWLTDHKCNLECRLWQHTSIQRSRTGFFLLWVVATNQYPQKSRLCQFSRHEKKQEKHRWRVAKFLNKTNKQKV